MSEEKLLKLNFNIISTLLTLEQYDKGEIILAAKSKPIEEIDEEFIKFSTELIPKLKLLLSSNGEDIGLFGNGDINKFKGILLNL
jgi:hypothetical protein